MNGILVLAGSGEFTPAMNEVDRYLLSLSSGKNIAIIPTASGQEGKSHIWIEDGIRHYKKFGAKPYGINIRNKKEANDLQNIAELERADIIYFSGGHPGYLFETMKNSKVWEKVIQKFKKGTILAGSSAGAMVMGEYVLSNAQEMGGNGENPKWIPAFGLVSHSIIPHFDFISRKLPEAFEKIEKFTPENIKENMIGIDEDTVLIIGSNDAKVMGKGRVIIFEKDMSKMFPSGSRLDFRLELKLSSRSKRKLV